MNSAGLEKNPTVEGLFRTARLAVAAVLLFAFSPRSVLAGGGPQNVLLVVNAQSASSVEIANEYQRLRNLPERNVLYLDDSYTANFYSGGDLRRTMTGAFYRTNVLWPALNYIRSEGLTNQIDYIVFSSDIPTRIDCASESNVTSIAGTPQFSITAMTAFGDLVEPVNSASNVAGTVMQSFRGFTFASNSPSTFTTNMTHATAWTASSNSHYYISTVLGWTHAFGNTTEEVKRYLQRSREADDTHPIATVYMDSNTDVRGQTRSSQFASTSNELASLGISSIVLTNNPSPFSLVNKPDVLGGVVGAAAPIVPAGSTFLKGSLVESLTSYGLYLDYTAQGQTRQTQYLGAGVAGTSGTITEPFAISGKFPAARMHAHYARGVTLGEAFHLSVQTPYHLLIMGDPLCRPHAYVPVVTVTNLAEGDVITGTRVFQPGATTASSNGIGSFQLFVDGVRQQTTSVGGSFSINTALLADGWHEARVVALENSAIATQGDKVVNFRSSNFGQQVQVASTNYNVSSAAGTFNVSVGPVTGFASVVVVAKGAQLLAVLGPAGGQAAIDVARLGAGRSVIRAYGVMSSGSVYSPPITVNVTNAPDVAPPVVSLFAPQVGTNGTFASLRSKPAYKNGDILWLNLVPSEPIAWTTNSVVAVGNGSSAPYLYQWNGLGSINPIPNVSTSTNPAVFRYTLADTRDANGSLPVATTLKDFAGNSAITTNFIATDFLPPYVAQSYVAPDIAIPGNKVNFSLLLSETALMAPALSINGQAATLAASNGNWLTYQYTVGVGDPAGTNRVEMTNLLDLAENSVATFRLSDNFEGKTSGARLTNYPPWSASTNSTQNGDVFITNSIVAPGSTRSVAFIDRPSGPTNQIYWYDLPQEVTAAAIEFDVFVDDRNTSGNVNFEVRPSTGTGSLREVALQISQATSNTWRLSALRQPGTVVLSTNFPVQTWHRVRFANDIVANTYSVFLDGVALTNNATYAVAFSNMYSLGNFQFRSTGNDEDLYLDNVVVETPAPMLEISADSDGDGIPDAWELKNFGNLTTATATSDFDGDGTADRNEWLAGTDPKNPKSGLFTTAVAANLAGTNLLTLTFPTVPGRNYRLQSGGSVTNWTDGNAYFATNSSLSLDVPMPPTNGFYWRLKLLP